MTHYDLRAVFYDPVTFKKLGINLPVVQVDEDFYEYLEEEMIEDSIEFGDFALLWERWAKENVWN